MKTWAAPLQRRISVGLSGIFRGVAGALVVNDGPLVKEKKNDTEARSFEELIHVSVVSAGVKTFFDKHTTRLHF